MKFAGSFPSGASINAPAAFLLGLFVACGVTTARAADLCLSFSQARAIHPNVYLTYHLDGGRRCWSPPTPTQRTARHRSYPQTPPVPAPRSTTYWPALASAVIVVDAALYEPTPATGWPRLLDIDELTSDDPLATSYWPPLDEPPFRERWTALPSNWFAAVMK